MSMDNLLPIGFAMMSSVGLFSYVLSYIRIEILMGEISEMPKAKDTKGDLCE